MYLSPADEATVAATRAGAVGLHKSRPVFCATHAVVRAMSGQTTVLSSRLSLLVFCEGAMGVE